MLKQPIENATRLENQSNKGITEFFFNTASGYACRFRGLEGNYIWYDFGYSFRTEGTFTIPTGTFSGTALEREIVKEEEISVAQ